ncbi:transposase family protein [Acidiphilium sp. PA]|uniref:transposase family protein n=1 Tax=Acidiphilium sp. PA TaxID=2871705 RepID=UPI0022438010|nr:transposase family protein [Acidiphilium sp. PA]MCW8309383.1 transposase family protein [Acidiphilium sp. PA]
MSKTLHLSPLAGIHVVDIHRDGASWIVEATGSNRGACPSCGAVSTVRHGLYRRSLQDLPTQGASVTIKLTVTRLKCLNQQCTRRTFSGCASNEIVKKARRTSRVAEIVRLLGHSTGGRPAERLLGCFGMVVSDDTVLRCLKSRSATPSATALRVVGIDDWSWRRGQTYGTIRGYA